MHFACRFVPEHFLLFAALDALLFCVLENRHALVPSVRHVYLAYAY
jgi:hypothetical protein